MSFLVPSDFTGRFAIAQAYNGDTAKLQSYIDTYEVQYLTQLLGAELYDLFIEGYGNDEEIYVKLFDAFSFDSETEGRPLISQGMREMLKGFIYTHYINGDLETTTTTGNVILEAEGGKKVTDDSSLYRTYNGSIGTYKTIRAYIQENRVDYPTYKGIYLGLIWSI
jgi:hypothetical protein